LFGSSSSSWIKVGGRTLVLVEIIFEMPARNGGTPRRMRKSNPDRRPKTGMQNLESPSSHAMRALLSDHFDNAADAQRRQKT
jgi:hypothetical protein